MRKHILPLVVSAKLPLKNFMTGKMMVIAMMMMTIYRVNQRDCHK